MSGGWLYGRISTLLAAGLSFLTAEPSFADGAVTLFKVVSPRGVGIIGIEVTTLQALGPGSDLSRLERILDRDGYARVWRYVVVQGVAGAFLQPAAPFPLTRLPNSRIVPYAPAIPVLASPDD
jgi:hypothetical protein